MHIGQSVIAMVTLPKVARCRAARIERVKLARYRQGRNRPPASGEADGVSRCLRPPTRRFPAPADTLPHWQRRHIEPALAIVVSSHLCDDRPGSRRHSSLHPCSASACRRRRPKRSRRAHSSRRRAAPTHLGVRRRHPTGREENEYIIAAAQSGFHEAVTDRLPLARRRWRRARARANCAHRTHVHRPRQPPDDRRYMKPAGPVAAPLLVLLSTALLPNEKMAPPLTALNPMSFAVTIEEPMKICAPAPLARMPAPPLRLDDERWISRLTAAPPTAMIPKLPLALTRVSWMLAKTTPAPAPDARKPSKFRFSWTRCNVTRALPAPGSTKMPPPPEELLPLNEMTLSLTKSWAAPLGTNSMPALLKLARCRQGRSRPPASGEADGVSRCLGHSQSLWTPCHTGKETASVPQVIAVSLHLRDDQLARPFIWGRAAPTRPWRRRRRPTGRDENEC